MALLSLCVATFGPSRIVPVYVNHNLRDSDELLKEIELNSANCSKLGLKLIVRTINKGSVQALSNTRRGGLEDAARTLRYQILEEERLRNSCTYILTAHHRQDQIETIVMRLISGSPPTSLRGISRMDPVRHLLRPLLGFSRAELQDYLTRLEFVWSTDSTNSSSKFRRNSIRNIIIPSVKAIVPDFESIILNLSQQAQSFCNAYSCSNSKNFLDVSTLRNMGLTGRTLAIFSMWDFVFPEKSLPMTLVNRVLDALSQNTDCTIGSNQAIFTLYHGKLYLTKDLEQVKADFQNFETEINPYLDGTYEILGNLKLLVGSHALAHLQITTSTQSNITLKPNLSPTFFNQTQNLEHALRLEACRFTGKVRLRFVKVGDWISLKDGKKMALKLLQDMKIPPILRFQVPVLVDDDGLCAIFGSVFGGKDRICVKFRTTLARNDFPLYICV